MIPIKLTPDQINYIDVLTMDKDAYHQALKIAITHTSNHIAALTKSEKEWWDGIYKTHDLDPSLAYKLGMVDGFVCVVQDEEKR